MMIAWTCDEHVSINDFGFSFEEAYKIVNHPALTDGA